MRGTLALAFTLSALQTPGGQAPAGTPAVAVSIDVILTDARGAAIKDLKADDFEVIEDRTPQRIDSVRFVVADGQGQSGATPLPVSSRADEQAEASRDGARLFAIFLDEYHITRGRGSDRARDLLMRFVTQELGPRDLVVIAKPLDSLLNLRLTHDRETLKRAITAFDGRRGDYKPRNDFERDYMAGDPARIEVIRSQIATSALNALATHLGGLGSGRKSIILVSEGFEGPLHRRGESLPTIDSVIRAAGRSTTSIYALDPRALDPSAEAAAGGADLLRRLADDTNGRAILAAGDVGSGMQQIVSDSTAYYVLTFRPAHPDDAGRFHGVEIRVKRPNTRLRARKGYWSASPEDLFLASLAARAAQPKPPPAAAPHASPLIRPWFGVARADDGRMRINFVWEPAARVPGDRAPVQTPSVITMKASKMDGTRIFEGTVAPLTSEGVFETAPGRLRVEMSIRDASERLLDTDVRDVIVSALAGPVEVGTAQVLRTRNAREYRALDADPNAVPVAARDFSRTERLLIRVPAYGSGDQFAVTASLQNRIGKTMRELPVEAMSSTGLYQIDLPLAAFAAGDYAVEIVAKSSDGQAREVVNFRVTP